MTKGNHMGGGNDYDDNDPYTPLELVAETVLSDSDMKIKFVLGW